MARDESRGWTAQLVRTMTGQAMPPLTLLGGSWTDGPLNDATSGSIRVAVKELRRYHDAWWSKWSGSVLLCFNGEPVVLGPIVADPHGFDTVDLKFGGLFSILEWRYATTADFYPGTEEILAGSVLEYSGTNLGAIAADLVRRGMNRPNGALPFAVASPSEQGTVNRVRNYQGHNISNNSVAKLIKEITAVINGPDVAFRPEWAPGQRGAAVRWVMYHGTEGMPQIAQKHTFSVDLTAPKTVLMEPAVTKDSGTLLGRAYMTGRGEGETTEIVIVERPTGMPAYMPMLETVVSDAQASNAHGLLTRRGEALVAPAETVQLSVNLSATNPIMPLNTWHTGDEFLVKVPDLLHVDRGTYRMRVVSRSGSVTSTVVKTELQPEEAYQR